MTPSKPGGFVDRLRSAARRDVNKAVDDGEGAVADPTPDRSPAVGTPSAGALAIDTPRHVPYGVDLAAGWAWRLLIIGAAAYALYSVLSFFAEITVPIAIAVLLTALLIPLVDALERAGLPRAVAALIVVLVAVAAIVGLLTLVGQQISTQLDDLRGQVVEGINQVQDWARTGPLHLSDKQLESWIDKTKDTINGGGDGEVVKRVTEVGSTVTHVAAGFFIAFFGTYFFLYQGNQIWDWIIGLFPRSAREHVDSSGRVAWVSLTAFVRATVIVAFTDALGIAIIAWALGVPLALAIGVLVFLGAFVPIIGAFLSGLVAVLVALVAQGFWTAVFMLIGVIVIQQIESHVLQPFLMGRLVAVHPLAIILAIAAGVTVSGIVGALVAVPLAACLNAVVKHLAAKANANEAEPAGRLEPGRAVPEPDTP